MNVMTVANHDTSSDATRQRAHALANLAMATLFEGELALASRDPLECERALREIVARTRAMANRMRGSDAPEGVRAAA